MDFSDSASYSCRRSNLKTKQKVLIFALFAFAIFHFAFEKIFPAAPWENKTQLFLLAIGIGLLFLFPSLFRWMTKIQISENGIFCRTPIRSYYFKWSEIKYTGLYISEENQIESIDSDQAKEFATQGIYQIHIWISTTEQNYYMQPLIPWKHSLEFDYDEEAWKLIRLYRQYT
jgi:hypothetical protein